MAESNADPSHSATAAREGQLWELSRGTSPLLISVPHAGIRIPPELMPRMTPEALAVPDTDWHVEKLYAFAPTLGVTLLSANLSRYVIDLNRDPSGASLYPGLNTTELCPTSTFDEQPVYLPTQAPTTKEVAQRIEQYYLPYHEVLAAELERIRAAHGFALLLDGHSIRSEVPRFFEGRLPDLNLGSADGQSADASVAQVAIEALRRSPLSSTVNGRFKGGYITRHFAAPAREIHALQLEMAQACYMDEGPPFAWHAGRAQGLVDTLKDLVQALLAWSPTQRTA